MKTDHVIFIGIGDAANDQAREENGMRAKLVVRMLAVHFAIIFIFMVSTNSSAQSSDATVQRKIEEINKRYEEEWVRIKRESDSIKNRAPTGAETVAGIDLDCKMKRNEIRLDIPEVSMSLQNISLHLPQVTMKTQRIVWDNPETFMGTTTCGWIPEFYDWQIRMRPVQCDLPQIRMVRREAKIDTPEFRWDRVDIKMHIPEFRMKSQEWVFDLPECEINSVSVETERIKADAKKLQDRSSALANEQQKEIKSVVVLDLTNRRQQLDGSFEQAITQVQQAIDKIKVYGIDPTKVRQENGSEVNLVELLQQIQEKRRFELEKLDQKISELST